MEKCNLNGSLSSQNEWEIYTVYVFPVLSNPLKTFDVLVLLDKTTFNSINISVTEYADILDRMIDIWGNHIDIQ